MEISITEKAEFVCKYYNWSIVPNTTCVSIDGPVERRGWNFYIKTTVGNSWFHETDIEKMYDVIKQNEYLNREINNLNEKGLLSPLVID